MARADRRRAQRAKPAKTAPVAASAAAAASGTAATVAEAAKSLSDGKTDKAWTLASLFDRLRRRGRDAT